MEKGHPHYMRTPCPRCQKKGYIDMDMELSCFKCVSCGASPINPYSSLPFKTQTEQKPVVSQEELDFLEYLIKEGKF